MLFEEGENDFGSPRTGEDGEGYRSEECGYQLRNTQDQRVAEKL